MKVRKSNRHDSENRAQPSEKPIRKYWAESPLGKYLNQSSRSDSDRNCMACGGYGNERAHIHALSYGGSNLPSNIHMLCSICHHESEMIEGYSYWLWLICKASLFHGGSDMTYEMDCKSSSDKTLVKYQYASEYPEKLKEYAKEYETLSIMQAWEIPQPMALIYLSNSSRFGFTFDEIDLDEIRKITEAPLMKKTSIHMTDEIWNGVVNA